MVLTTKIFFYFGEKLVYWSKMLYWPLKNAGKKQRIRTKFYLAKRDVLNNLRKKNSERTFGSNVGDLPVSSWNGNANFGQSDVCK